jgi:hypothetical protein
MLSRVHCSIEYRQNVGWIIRDGHIVKMKDGKYENRVSTNGIWYSKFNQGYMLEKIP